MNSTRNVGENKRSKLINLKVNASEYAAIEEQAKINAGGNISRWLRQAGMTPVEQAACAEAEVSYDQDEYED